MTDSQPESSSFDFLADGNRRDPVDGPSFDTPNEFHVVESEESVGGLAAAQAIPVSAMTKTLKKRQSITPVEPANSFEKKWYSLLIQRQRRILRGDEVPSTLPFKLLAAYALAITAAFAYFVLKQSEHALESLPDLKPQAAGEYQHIPADADLPPGHEIRLGESRRFGNLIIRPIRVSREPLEFVHYMDASSVRPPEETVLKLWLEFTVESNRAFVPLDTELLTKRSARPDQPDKILASTFLCKSSDRKLRRKIVFNYEHPVGSEWNLKNQNIGKLFQPGDLEMCYVACEPRGYQQLVAQNEPMTWRIQIRKGISSGGNGVTTLVDIVFNPDQISG